MSAADIHVLLMLENSILFVRLCEMLLSVSDLYADKSKDDGLFDC
jgi:hypothetical protein